MARATLAALALAKGIPPKLLEKFATADERGVIFAYKDLDGTPARSHVRHNLESAQPSSWANDGSKIVAFGSHLIAHWHGKGEPILMGAEGDTDTLSGWVAQVPTIGIPGWSMYKLITRAHVDPFAEFHIAFDSDEAGERGVSQMAKHLREIGYAGKIRRLSPAPYKDLTEWRLACNGTFADELAARRAQAPEVPVEATPPTASHSSRPLLVTQRLSEIESRPIDWLWQDRIPRNEPSIIGGPPGVGKSFVVGALVAAITTGQTPPGGGDITEPGDVLILALEDDASRVLRSRYEAMGADLDRVHVIQGVSEGSDRVAPFTLHHIEALERKLDTLPNVVAVTIDPVSGLMGGADTHRSNEVRERLDPFLDSMNRRGITTLFVTHTNKSVALAGASRIEGSYGGFVGRARAVLGVGRDPESGVHGVGVLKSNYGRTDVPVIGFEIDETGRFLWRAEALAISASELFEQAGSEQQQSEMNEARESIVSALHTSTLMAGDLQKAVRKDGVADITFRRARAKMKKEGVIKRTGGGKYGPVWWSLSDAPISSLAHDSLVRLIHNDEPENVLMSQTTLQAEDSW
jgi:putative DNA primase/helicase